MRHTLKIQLFNERCSRPIHLFEADSCRTWHVACHDKLLPPPPGCVIVLQIFAPERHDGRGNIRPAVVCRATPTAGIQLANRLPAEWNFNDPWASIFEQAAAYILSPSRKRFAVSSSIAFSGQFSVSKLRNR